MTTEQQRTDAQYDAVIKNCLDIFAKKTADYGTAWRVLRPISITDQIYIKAQRIRTIQEKGVQRVHDDLEGEFIGIINYAVIGLMQMQLPTDAPEDLEVDETISRYKEVITVVKALMHDKNHDYGEAWRHMSQESFVDLILMKLHRMRQIIANGGQTLISEGLDANYHDIINYAVFATILRRQAAV
ncbi:DUF1599 domain-containing protein [Pseudocnuella soli]|uniref:DUF1599 domain-containing protein n=1 Tax=Pseudocnuella soli TaxID=2502779 RepID=UPI00104B4390|nr:DUF1599 domain-containing protein [Pseudocnuella soli]